ncbi:hypothetical protein bthur0007_55250 [Bacillus thuringiensis serovar monterrey BGSC 4AJ1]|nr:hypothetical protein bthur0007_55250 [Bacillus thuringiensis serovar monterrey BGSC 4AJ1]
MNFSTREIEKLMGMHRPCFERLDKSNYKIKGVVWNDA